MKTLMNSILTLAFISMSLNALADDTIPGKNRNRDELRSHMWEIQKDDGRLKKAVKRGKSETGFCNTCHGKKGISKHAWEPNLAEQDATYLLDQLINFATGKRKNLVMNDLASNLQDGQLVDIALYYHEMKNTYFPDEINPEHITRGKKIYNEICTVCHGPDGKGRPGFARLSGQKAEYLVNNLTKFKGDSRRQSTTMGGVVAKLTDKDIEVVASYISSMNTPEE